jgi:hypothetical protein
MKYRVEVGDDVIDEIARSTEQMNGNEICDVFRDATLSALRRNEKVANQQLAELIGQARQAQQRTFELGTQPGMSARGRMPVTLVDPAIRPDIPLRIAFEAQQSRTAIRWTR